jgi:hypothetical protein
MLLLPLPGFPFRTPYLPPLTAVRPKILFLPGGTLQSRFVSEYRTFLAQNPGLFYHNQMIAISTSF